MPLSLTTPLIVVHTQVAYLGPEGDPLWFTIEKDSDELIPTIEETRPVPFVSTPPSVIPVLPIAKDQLVSVCQYDRKAEKLSAPLVVGRMAIASDKMAGDGNRKAVFVLHAWNDHLWDVGSKPDVPEPSVIAEATREEGEDSGPQEPSTLEQEQAPTQTSSSHTTTIASYLSLQEVTDILHKSISTILPVSPFPILSTQFYTNYILPCRPATTTSDVTIKNSTHQSLTAFLKAAEKASLLTLKSPQKHLQQKDLLVMSVNKTHPSVLGHVNYETLKDAEEKAAKKAKFEKESEKRSELGVRLLWKPHLESVYLFESIGKDPKNSIQCKRSELFSTFISPRNLVNKNDKAYINLDDLLRTCIYAKQQSKPAMAGNTNASLLDSEPILVKKVIAKMQDWYEIVRNGETSQKQGTLKLIQVLTTPRGPKKALTFVTGFEPFVTVGAETMADELKRKCASAASVSPLPWKEASMKVMVQGKQSKAVLEFLTSHGCPSNGLSSVIHKPFGTVQSPPSLPTRAWPGRALQRGSPLQGFFTSLGYQAM
ncbi:eukaryotic translation initiation factor SUI1 family protein [Amanita muscaria]